MPELRVGGLAPISTVDWPGELAATVFCQGCGWDCAYCHNPQLIPARSQDEIAWADVAEFLRSRVGLLDGVVFSGGEPLLQAALPETIEEVRALGFRVALHTNGQLPDRLAEVMGLVDWVGLDMKAPFEPAERYATVTGVRDSGPSARASLGLLVRSGVPFEVRTTVHSSLLGDDDLRMLADELRSAGVAKWALQAYRRTGVRAERDLGPSARPSEDLLGELREGFEAFELRE